MNDWIIISPDGTTISSNEIIVENFQVLGFVQADSVVDAFEKLKEEYHYLKGSGFNEVWIYQIISGSPYVTYLGDDSEDNELKDELVKKIINILIENGYYDIVFDFRDDDSFHFEGYSDAFQEIRVDVDGEMVKVYDRYIGEKHFVHMGNFRFAD
ncbi:hypothetical protein V7124_21780 [Neobacillus niacini]|uniref:hypothetical protein n=1 Tax=Neobacillus niacini TaxID=86668 RepID=UPI002FFFA01D